MVSVQKLFLPNDSQGFRVFKLRTIFQMFEYQGVDFRFVFVITEAVT